MTGLRILTTLSTEKEKSSLGVKPQGVVTNLHNYISKTNISNNKKKSVQQVGPAPHIGSTHL